ncbi:MAG: tyrosine-type recombinase/integrase, partial [Planctomycetia bacterium]
LERLIERRKGMGFNGREFLFCGITKGDKFQAWGTRLKDAYIRSMLPRLGKKAGIEKRIHAHGFRHSLATELAKEKQSLGAISAQLGHSSVAVTDRYIQKIAPTELVKVMQEKNRLG